jgi:hypothetical protein
MGPCAGSHVLGPVCCRWGGHLGFPAAKRGHEAAAGAAHDEFDLRVNTAHQLGSFARDTPVLGRTLRTRLPWTIHLVAQRPQTHVVSRALAALAALAAAAAPVALTAALTAVHGARTPCIGSAPVRER